MSSSVSNDNCTLTQSIQTDTSSRSNVDTSSHYYCGRHKKPRQCRRVRQRKDHLLLKKQSDCSPLQSARGLGTSHTHPQFPHVPSPNGRYPAAAAAGSNKNIIYLIENKGLIASWGQNAGQTGQTCFNSKGVLESRAAIGLSLDFASIIEYTDGVATTNVGPGRAPGSGESDRRVTVSDATL